ncbi:MAG: hypothetical protein R3290_09715 [Acidimicrobiia bacterium]|nr:hypothetical protein [Acidimicrobiia bacterium]
MIAVALFVVTPATPSPAGMHASCAGAGGPEQPVSGTYEGEFDGLVLIEGEPRPGVDLSIGTAVRSDALRLEVEHPGARADAVFSGEAGAEVSTTLDVVDEEGGRAVRTGEAVEADLTVADAGTGDAFDLTGTVPGGTFDISVIAGGESAGTTGTAESGEITFTLEVEAFDCTSVSGRIAEDAGEALAVFGPLGLSVAVEGRWRATMVDVDPAVEERVTRAVAEARSDGGAAAIDDLVSLAAELQSGDPYGHEACQAERLLQAARELIVERTGSMVDFLEAEWSRDPSGSFSAAPSPASMRGGRTMLHDTIAQAQLHGVDCAPEVASAWELVAAVSDHLYEQADSPGEMASELGHSIASGGSADPDRLMEVVCRDPRYC